MSQSTSAYFSNSIVGVPQIGGDVDIYESHTYPKFTIGTKMEREDGSIFRYCCFGAAVNRGMIVAPDYSVDELPCSGYSANAVIATSSTYQQGVERAGLYPNMKGSRFMCITYTTTTKDDLAGGYITISSGTGIGYTYRIKGNAVSSGTSCIVTLYDPLVVGLDATGDIAISPSKYTRLKPAGAASTSGFPTGISISTIATSSPFGWIQTRGIVGVAWSGAVTANIQATAVLSETDVGCAKQLGMGIVAANTSSILANLLSVAPVIGRIVVATATSGHALVNVQLE